MKNSIRSLCAQETCCEDPAIPFTALCLGQKSADLHMFGRNFQCSHARWFDVRGCPEAKSGGLHSTFTERISIRICCRMHACRCPYNWLLREEQLGVIKFTSRLQESLFPLLRFRGQRMCCKKMHSSKSSYKTTAKPLLPKSAFLQISKLQHLLWLCSSRAPLVQAALYLLLNVRKQTYACISEG